ncbi:hypothetical protein [Halomonas sp.]|uniref:hypothetical protein n=1 Tax=Halomonas sp. TaxID=1486246 RepID=UPI00384AB455
MTKEILHVSSRCGGGKSRETIRELVDHIKGKQPCEETYLFASKTNELTGQNLKMFVEFTQQQTGLTIPVKRIDSETHKGSVIRDLSELLITGFNGVIFISHSTLATIQPSLLKNTRVVIDEVPQELAGCLTVRHAAKDHGYPWEKYLINTASNHDGYMRTRLNPNADEDDIRRYISNLRGGIDNVTTTNVADLLEFLLADYEVVYTTTTNSDGTLNCLYQAIHYHRLHELSRNVDFLAILSAQLKDTLFGFVAEKHLKLKIVNKPINSSSAANLPMRHKNKVRIIPFLQKGRWSTTLKMKTANECLYKNGQPVTSPIPVWMLAQEMTEFILGKEDFLITLNTKEKLLDSLDRDGVERTSLAVHGMNSYRKLHHAAYLASSNPTPFDIKALLMFAKDHGLDGQELIDTVIAERCHEAAYQCVARTSIRNHKHDPNKEHIIIVPDMQYANYVAKWFENGCAKIDTQFSYTTLYEEAQKAAEESRRMIIIHIISEKMKRKEKLKSIIDKSGISRSTYKRYKEEFRAELENLGLIPPKRSSAKTDTKTAA